MANRFIPWSDVGRIWLRQDSVPELSPKDVVEIVLGSMANNDSPSPDAGLQQAFEFASPSNKRSTGPFWHFKAIVEQPAYAPLINHTRRTLGTRVCRKQYRIDSHYGRWFQW